MSARSALSVCLQWALPIAKVIGLGLVLGVTTFFGLMAHRVSKAPTGLPWVGLKEKRFLPRLRAACREAKAGRTVIEDAWEKVRRRPAACAYTMGGADVRIVCPV